MEYREFERALHDCFEQNGIGGLLDDGKSAQLFGLAEALVETNKHINLTAITDPEGIIFKHFADCAVLCEFARGAKSAVDIGCGAGFPSLPLAILCPEISVTAVDSTAKKIRFVRETAESLGVKNLCTVAARAEEYVAETRESFDLATSRAVARMNVLCELCMPFVAQGGRFVPLKASRASEELDEARHAIEILGGSIESEHSRQISFAGESLERHLFVIRKNGHSPMKYPRKYAQIVKDPL